MTMVPKNWPKDVPVPPPTPRHYYDGIEWMGRHMAELRRDYPDQWVAVYEGDVVAAGTNLAEVERLANEKTGKRDIAIDLITAGIRIYSRICILPD